MHSKVIGGSDELGTKTNAATCHTRKRCLCCQPVRLPLKEDQKKKKEKNTKNENKNESIMNKIERSN